MSEDTAATRGYRKSREGLVVSDKMDKTVVVEVEDRRSAAASALAITPPLALA